MTLKEIVEQLEWCKYECEAGALENNVAFVELKKLAEASRFKFVKDDDGHGYIIPADKTDEFRAWVEAGPYWDDWEGHDYNDENIGGSFTRYSFADPQEDER